MRGLSITGLMCAAVLLGACAAREPREAPHHYSTARDGSRTACYAAPTPGEYECVPLVYADHYADPFWHGYYGWPAWPYYDAFYPYPPRVIVVQPAPPPRHHFLPRDKKPR